MKKRGFTLLELLTTITIVGVISLIATNGILSNIPDFKTNESAKIVEQVLKKARSEAIKKSETVTADFAYAGINHGDNGGKINIKESDGTIIQTEYLYKNVLLNLSETTISSNKVNFDYRGQPVDNSGSPSGFDNDNNKISISYYNKGTATNKKSVLITPMTGTIVED